MPPLEVPGSEASRAGGVAASPFDLVVAPFSVSALPPAPPRQRRLMRCGAVDVGGVLALIEDASTEGAECLRRGRRYLPLALGARHVAAVPIFVDQLELLCLGGADDSEPDVLAQAEMLSLKQAVVESGARLCGDRRRLVCRCTGGAVRRFAYVLVARDEANANSAVTVCGPTRRSRA